MTTAVEMCVCEGPGYCPRYNRQMVGRLYQICRGEGVDTETAAEYRALWSTPEYVAGTVDHVLASGVQCPYFGEPVVEDGETKLRECTTCSGRVRLKLSYCTHPAREPDEVSTHDCASCGYRPRRTEAAQHLVLRCDLSPGDALVASASIYSLHRANPSRFLTAYEGTAKEIYDYNPDITPAEKLDPEKVRHLMLHYPAINQCNQRGIHMMQAYCEYLEDMLRVKVPLAINRPVIYVSNREKSWYSQVREITGDDRKFWLVNAGRKGDFTAKFWGTKRFQEVVNILQGKVQFVQIGEAGHHHPPLDGVINLVGRTDGRQLIRLVYHCQGVVSGVSYPMHLAAALEKPAVVVAGGREPVQWNSYPRQQLLHTVGMLECCRGSGCWKSRVEDLGDGDEKSRSLCERPVLNGEKVPECLAMITPEEVAEKILRFSEKQT